MLNKKQPQSPYPEWMVVYSSYDVLDAHIVAGRLEVEGIKTLVNQQPGARALGITIGSLGEVTVLVSSGDYERSLAILESPEFDALPDTTDDISYHWDEDEDE
jgi:Putative prokaryotic signal transducing protein